MFLLSSLHLLLNPLSQLASFSSHSNRPHHALLLQILFLLPIRVKVTSLNERQSDPKQYQQHHHNYQPYSMLPGPQLGCYRFGQPLCCGTRNISCKSLDNSRRPIFSFEPNNEQQVREVRLGNYCIGREILPNLVALNERGAQLLHTLGQREHFRLLQSDGRRRRKKKVAENFQEREETLIQFGSKNQILEWEGVEQVDMDDMQQSPVVRYSLLNRYLPVRIVKRRIQVPTPTAGQAEGDEAKEQREAMVTTAPADERWPLNILMESSADCFCDESCTQYRDCCANYAQACPAIACQVSEWSEWTECLPDNGHCGVGTRERRRRMLREKKNAGRECPELSETIACFRQCQMANRDLTTVALLLDYQFSDARRDLPSVFFRKQFTTNKNGSSKTTLSQGERQRQKEGAEKRGGHIQYCVHYRIIWLNQECTDEQHQWHTQLSPGKVICAECQPEAQLHRQMPRCASDLEDGQSGFWKLIGPKYCYGIWHRLLSSSGNVHPPLGCKCGELFPQLTPFLMV